MESKPTQPVSWIKEQFAFQFQEVYRMQQVNEEVKEGKTVGTMLV